MRINRILQKAFMDSPSPAFVKGFAWLPWPYLKCSSPWVPLALFEWFPTFPKVCEPSLFALQYLLRFPRICAWIIYVRLFLWAPPGPLAPFGSSCLLFSDSSRCLHVH